MVTNKKVLAIIPARGGSKRVPRKNIKEFLGKPLLAWTIEVAKESGVLDRIVLTTDDQEIAEIGKKYGAEIPFIRPKELAQDTSTALETLQHTIKWLKDNENYEIDWFVLLEPSSPGRQPFHIKEVVDLFQTKNDINSIIGISELSSNQGPLKALRLNANGLAIRYTDGEKIRNLAHCTQDIEKSYFINSSIYAFKTQNLFSDSSSLWGDNVFGYIMDSKYAMDIDTLDDWIIAQAKFIKLLEESNKQ